jgi:hypothetical protein
MMDKKIIVIIFLFCYLLVVGQNPGFYGRRVSVGYGILASPAWIGSSGHTPINLLHDVHIEVAAKKRLSIGFSTRFYNAVYGNGRIVQINSNYSSDYSQIDESPSGTTQIKAINYMLYFKLFGANYVAPWGRYFTFGATINTFKSTYSPSEMYVKTEQYLNYPISGYVYGKYSNFGSTEQSFARFDVMLGFGRSRVIAKRVIIDYGYNINLMALALTLFDAPDDNVFAENYLYPSEYIEKTSAARVRGVNRFNLFLKVGILLF